MKLSYFYFVIIVEFLSFFITKLTNGHILKSAQACDMLIAIDERLYNEYNRNIENVTTMANEMVKRLNNVYQK